MATINIFEADQRGRARMLGEKFGICTDPDDGEAFKISCKIRFALENAQDAGEWEYAFPGCSRMYARAVEKKSAERWSSKFDGGLNLHLALADDRNTPAFAEGAAKVSNLVLTLSQALQVVDATMTFGGVPTREVETWLASLKGAFLLTSSNAQLSLIPKVVAA